MIKERDETMQSTPPPRQIIQGGVWDNVPQQSAFPQQGLQVGHYPSTNATTALVLSIVGLAAGFACFPLCGLLAIPGVVMGNSAANLAGSMPGHPDTGTAKAAQVVGWITLGLMLIFVAFIAILIFADL
tara:strand:+ start:866 stop:1252 length:387 start_codon:yes stop_codon:yes gene_type:complete